MHRVSPSGRRNAATSPVPEAERAAVGWAPLVGDLQLRLFALSTALAEGTVPTAFSEGAVLIAAEALSLATSRYRTARRRASLPATSNPPANRIQVEGSGTGFR